ncbi:MAG: signal peptidase I [Candidatus Woesearchaeota archaeon]
MAKTKEKKKPTSTLGKIWKFIWEDNSVWSWIANIILAFIIIKFLFYPFLGLIFHTGFPIVAVVSESMEHNDGFYDWWYQDARCIDGDKCAQWEWYLERDIKEEDFKKFDFSNGFNKGDIIFLVGKAPEEIKAGEVIVYQAGKAYPIIHRVVDSWEQNSTIYFKTKGDNNPDSIQDARLNENKVSSTQLLGKAVFKVPWLGYVKIWFVDLINLIAR